MKLLSRTKNHRVLSGLMQLQNQTKHQKTSKSKLIDWIRTDKQLISELSCGRYASVCFIVDNFLYTVGGGDQGSGYVDDMLKIDLDTHKTQVKQTYPYGNFQSLVQLKDQSVLVFGGKANGYSKTLWRHHPLDGRGWEKVEYTGKGPAGVYGHSAALSLDYRIMYVFGGYDNETGLNNDFHEYSIKKSIWAPVKATNDGPANRYGHSSRVKEKTRRSYVSIWSRGGGKIVYNDLWLFHFQSSTWTQVEIKNSGSGPAGRYGCAA